jgi:hypothetical protein
MSSAIVPSSDQTGENAPETAPVGILEDEGSHAVWM